MKSIRRCSVFVMSSLCIATTVVLFPFYSHFSVFMTLSASSFSFIPVIQFQRQFMNSDHYRAVHSSGFLTAFHPIPFKKTVERRTRKLNRDEKIEQELARARISIRRAALRTGRSPGIKDNDYVASAEVYRNPNAFFRSYLEMERRFKVYVYLEGDLPITHYGPCKNLYTIEGKFINEMEHGVGRFRTMDADQAQVYFMPFSVTWMVKYLYKPLSYNLDPVRQFVSDYVRVVSIKYPFWNRTLGADHFMLACHDWGPHASQGNLFLYNTSIRVLCNANTSEGFDPKKDASLPEIHLLDGNISPKLLNSSSLHGPRRHLAFFAGGLHGPIRPILFNHWKNKDKDMLVYEYLPKDQGLDYYGLMLQSKFCLCPSGYEVASPRIVEAIYAECVPVILSKHYALPFNDVLRWEGFSIQVEVEDIPRLKEILSSVSSEKYDRLKAGLRTVKKHFVLNQPAQRFDVFHMILHFVWLRRLNLRLA